MPKTITLMQGPFTRKNQPKALQVEGRNFLTIAHDPSSLMGKCKETREVHLMVVKGEVESRIQLAFKFRLRCRLCWRSLMM